MEAMSSTWRVDSTWSTVRTAIEGTKTGSAKSNPCPAPQNQAQIEDECVAALWWACCDSCATIAGEVSAGTINRQAARARTRICRLNRFTPTYRTDAACIGLLP